MSEPQRTVAHDVFLNGVGIHTGLPVSVRVLPAPPDTGIVFVRT
ncbi:MAG: UDP-3-O-acyl-N-acetylglucosamine deacetylase, partial [Candidatus Omnitrophica bacterium]|nr:UDP-3-O-acyl-N-acetylglucosamine deacetylase [Candidatus Omnitrophota bacterium]